LTSKNGNHPTAIEEEQKSTAESTEVQNGDDQTTNTNTTNSIQIETNDPSIPQSPLNAPSPVPKSNPYANDLDGGALRNEFIPNWTSLQFEAFVQELADVTDELAEREEAWRRVDVFKAVWEHILEVERRFWPDIGVSF
jgi:hypothetical protein